MRIASNEANEQKMRQYRDVVRVSGHAALKRRLYIPPQLAAGPKLAGIFSQSEISIKKRWPIEKLRAGKPFRVKDDFIVGFTINSILKKGKNDFFPRKIVLAMGWCPQVCPL